MFEDGPWVTRNLIGRAKSGLASGFDDKGIFELACVFDSVRLSSGFTYGALNDIMSKRVRQQDGLDDDRAAKRVRPSSPDRLSKLSDELILRVLSFLPVSQLAVCQRYVSTIA